MTTDLNQKPLLIYDSDCGFCNYWAVYWNKLTGDSVQYRPYQEVSSRYPSISIEEFQRAVQYVAPDGKISQAAEASFLTLSHSANNRYLLTLYRYLPGFAFISEKIYALIAAHRDFFYRISLFFWGKEHEPPKYDAIAWLFVRLLGIIFLCAFASFGVQALGLIGSQGIIPITEITQIAHDRFGVMGYWLLPMVFWINNSDLAVQLTCWGGALLSLLLIFNLAPRICLLVLYFLYLSLCSAGQLFMTFQWDIYLLETSIITIFLLTYQTTGIWLLRWLLLRFMFAGGLVKILSGDPTWHDFTALSYYFMTEPLPTPLAWYAHHLPQALLHACTMGTLFIELVMPFFIFTPRRLRFFAGFSILLLQTLILITGNYNFFNLLTMLLCLTLFDDAAIRKFIPKKIVAQKKLSHNKIMLATTIAFISITVPLSLAQFYARINNTLPRFILQVMGYADPLHLVNLYGPFAVITTHRMEINIEGSNDGVNWREYTFKYKPVDINNPLKWNIPHQPRLDWQMWFAALGTIDNNQWILRVMQRILENSQSVLALLDYNPFPGAAPLYLRAPFYEYDFTTPEERAATGAIWKRNLVGMYVPIVHLKMDTK